MKYILLLSLTLFSLNGKAQNSALLNPEFNSEQKAVFQMVMQVFNGMKQGDSSMVKNAFTGNPQAYTIYSKDGETVHKKDNIQKFYDAIGTPHEKDWNEYSWNYNIKIDGALAQVWCDYAFYLEDQFSHCGVDAFQLVKVNSDWKIFVLSDTRRKKGCEVPEIGERYAP